MDAIRNTESSVISPVLRQQLQPLMTLAAVLVLRPTNASVAHSWCSNCCKSTFEAVGLAPGFFVVVHGPDRAKRTHSRRRV
jgi:hypothetical protein